MKIISKFHDYYDSASAWRDESLCYIRQTSEPVIARKQGTYTKNGTTAEIAESLRNAKAVLAEMPVCSFATNFVVAFCGKLYPGYKTFENECFYSPEKMIQAFNKIIKINVDLHPKFKRYTRTQYNSSLPLERDWKDRVESLTSFSKVISTWRKPNLSCQNWKRFNTNVSLDLDSKSFRVLKSPVYMLYFEHVNDRSAATLLINNPCLKDLSFASQVDPYTAFQELSMFIGNDLVDQMDPNIERSDELIRDQKGFDKWSFRKPGKKGMK